VLVAKKVSLVFVCVCFYTNKSVGRWRTKVPEWMPKSTKAEICIHLFGQLEKVAQKLECRPGDLCSGRHSYRQRGLKTFRDKKEHAETPCLRINSDFSKKIKKSGAAAYGNKSWPR